MLRHVLVPLDGSKLAEEALEHALNIIGPKGKITLLSAVDIPEVPVYGYYPPATMPDFELTIKDLLPQAEVYLKSIAERIQGDAVEVAVQAEIGDPAEVIVEKSLQNHVDAVVMSTHGRSGLNRWLFGSVTSKVLDAKPCPVYVIPSKGKSDSA